VFFVWYGDGVGITGKEGCNIFSPNLLSAISKVTWAVKLCSILHNPPVLNLGCQLKQADLLSGLIVCVCLVTGPPNGLPPLLFCLRESVVVCNYAGGRVGSVAGRAGHVAGRASDTARRASTVTSS